MKSLQYTSATSADLHEILDYIAEDRPHTAVQIFRVLDGARHIDFLFD